MRTSQKLFALISILIPPTAFYILLAKSLLTVPLQDDYHAILGFLLQWKNDRGLQRVLDILSYQHNDYRFMFENAIVALQYSILGHTDLRSLSILGDLFVLLLFAVLWLIWHDSGKRPAYTLLAFIPVSWILFQLQYESTLNLPTPALQFIPVLAFALLACYFAPRQGLRSFIGCIISFLLCVASCANGLFLIPTIFVLYVQTRNYKRLALWCTISVIVTVIYFHGYNFASEMPNTHVDNTFASIGQHLSPLFAAAFLGSIAALRNPWPAIVAGILFLGIFVAATFDRLFVRRPALYYSCLFFFITAAAVSGLRSSFGIQAAIASRYRINSALLVILLYSYLADRFYGLRIPPVLLKSSVTLSGILLIAFTFISDRTGERLLLIKRRAVENEMLRWERHDPRHPVSAAFSGDLTAVNENNGLFDPVELYLTESIHEGIYRLPPLPTDR